MSDFKYKDADLDDPIQLNAFATELTAILIDPTLSNEEREAICLDAFNGNEHKTRMFLWSLKQQGMIKEPFLKKYEKWIQYGLGLVALYFVFGLIMVIVDFFAK